MNVSNLLNTESLRSLEPGEFAYETCQRDRLQALQEKAFNAISYIKKSDAARKYRTMQVPRDDQNHTNQSQVYVWRDA